MNGNSIQSTIFSEYSDIWDNQKRISASNSKIADHEINKLKAELLYTDDNKPVIDSKEILIHFLPEQVSISQPYISRWPY